MLILDSFLLFQKRIVFVGLNRQRVSLTMSIFPRTDPAEEFITIDKSPENVTNTSQISSRRLMLLKNGAENALSRGPKVGCPVRELLIHNLV